MIFNKFFSMKSSSEIVVHFLVWIGKLKETHHVYILRKLPSGKITRRKPL